MVLIETFSSFPVDDIKRVLDTMSSVKMSVFHWHVVDSQSFPLTIPGFEKLARKGAYSRKEIYSSSDVQSIVKYAAEVRVYSFSKHPRFVLL